MIEVAGALIRQGDKFLICQRAPKKARGMLWEFVGGKLEKNETGPEALVRECREELGIEVAVVRKFMDVTHVYPDITVHLTVYLTSIVSGTPQLLEHNDIRYITPPEISSYEFCPADAPILQKLQEEWDTI